MKHKRNHRDKREKELQRGECEIRPAPFLSGVKLRTPFGCYDAAHRKMRIATPVCALVRNDTGIVTHSVGFSCGSCRMLLSLRGA